MLNNRRTFISNHFLKLLIEQAPESRDSEAVAEEVDDDADGGLQGPDPLDPDWDVDQIEFESDGIWDSIF